MGACISYYTGMLLVKVSNKTQCNRYEDFADKLYGKRCKTITSIFNLACLIGFITSYIVYIKSMMPKILLLFINENDLPNFIGDNYWGKVFWGTLFAFGMLFPMSIPRSINALRFTSLFGVLCSVYLSLAVFFVFYCDKEVVPDPSANMKETKLFNVSFSGVVSTFPLIIFAYMYQVNIPMIYTELETRNSSAMSKVLVLGTVGAVILYIIVGVWGYATFVNNPADPNAESALADANILSAPYPKDVIPITIGNFALFFAIATAAPLCVLPAKDTVEEIVAKGDHNRKLTKKENLLATLILVIGSYLLACVIPSIQDAMTLVGSTTNPTVGFILPIVYYWKTLDKNAAWWSTHKLIAILVALFIIAISCLSLYNFFSTKLG